MLKFSTVSCQRCKSFQVDKLGGDKHQRQKCFSLIQQVCMIVRKIRVQRAFRLAMQQLLATNHSNNDRTTASHSAQSLDWSREAMNELRSGYRF